MLLDEKLEWLAGVFTIIRAVAGDYGLPIVTFEEWLISAGYIQ